MAEELPQNPMTKVELKNALIEDTMLGYEDHGIMTCFLYLDYGDSGAQGAGGYCLDTPKKEKDGKFSRKGVALGMDLIMRILNIVGVSKWEDLKGKHIRVKASLSGVQAIGNFLKDDWLDFKEFYKEIDD